MKTNHSQSSASTAGFMARLGDRVSGLLQGFDRLRLRGSRGEWAINGFRNRDLCRWLSPGKCSAQEAKRRSRSIGRRILLLRMHGLVAKVSHTHRYVLTEKGRVVITALLAAADADTEQLTKIAA